MKQVHPKTPKQKVLDKYPTAECSRLSINPVKYWVWTHDPFFLAEGNNPKHAWMNALKTISQEN